MEPVENNLRFPGQYFDAETGLHYNRFRYYDPQIGQFVQPDPSKLVGTEFFGDNVIKVGKNDLEELETQGKIRIITPDDAHDIISSHPKKKIRKQAGNIRQNMLRNNEILIQGKIPASKCS